MQGKSGKLELLGKSRENSKRCPRVVYQQKRYITDHNLPQVLRQARFKSIINKTVQYKVITKMSYETADKRRLKMRTK
jgi:hypothetical protein